MSTASSSTELTAEGFLLQLLQEQSDLSAVERFSVWHDLAPDDLPHDAAPEQARYYQSLLPATLPSVDEQYGFEVDLDACSGCKACVVACHTLNGLEEEESWRRVGAFTVNEPLPQLRYVTTACHHCADPGCLNGCPVIAYDKDPLTGIVRHLDDQCIGCKYCTMMCPYEVPQYSSRLGIVRKCDMCHQRLSVGEAPACVQSCPNEAISIRNVSRHKQYGPEEILVPSAPRSDLTHPTTKYVGQGSLSGLATPQDSQVDHAHESHWPLAVMLVMTQAAVGLIMMERLLAAYQSVVGNPISPVQTLVASALALGLALIGLSIAPLHLGQPLRAWRVFLGLRTSWLSREAVLFGKFVGALLLAVLLMSLNVAETDNLWIRRIPGWVDGLLLGSALALGIAGLFSSAMIYVVTRRELWRFSRTSQRFMGSAVVLGLALLAAATGNAFLAACAAMAVTVKLTWEWSIYLGRQRASDTTFQARSRRLVHRELSSWASWRIALSSIGALFCVGAIALLLTSRHTAGSSVMLLASALMIGGEVFERLLYFASVVFDRMPGVMK